MLQRLTVLHTHFFYTYIYKAQAREKTSTMSSLSEPDLFAGCLLLFEERSLRALVIIGLSFSAYYIGCGGVPGECVRGVGEWIKITRNSEAVR